MACRKSYPQNTYDIYCLSTDTKPTDCGTGTTAYEVDTKKGWVFIEGTENVNPITSNGWWEV